MPPKRRKPNLRSVKRHCTYTVVELAQVMGVTPNTVRAWIKSGLKPIDDQYPTCFWGEDVQAFHKAKKQLRKQTCAEDEFFCLKCRSPRRPFGGLVEIKAHHPKITKLQGLCPTCETVMIRPVATAQIKARLHLFNADSKDTGGGIQKP